MTRGIDATFLAAAQAATLEPIWLVEIPTGLVSPTHLRYTSAEQDVTFPDGGDVYESRPIRFGSVRIETTQANPNDLVVGDADHAIKVHLENGAEFRNQVAKLIRIERSLTSSSDYQQTDSFRILKAEPRPDRVVFSLAQLGSILDRTGPRGRVTIQDFPGIPQDFS